MLSFTEFVKQTKLPIEKVTAFYQSVGEKLSNVVPVSAVDGLIFNAFPNRKLTATSVSGIVLPSLALRKKGDGKITIYERKYSDSDVTITVKMSTSDMYYASNYEFNDEYRQTGRSGNYSLDFVVKFQAEGVKSVEKLDNYGNATVKHDFSNIAEASGEILAFANRYMNVYAQELDRKVARVKAKAQKAIEKEENRNPTKVRQNFMTKATAVEKKVFETLEKNYKKTLEDSFYNFALAIQEKFAEVTKDARYPIPYGNNAWNIHYAYTEQDVARFEFGPEAWLCFATEKEVKDFAGAQALLEIASVIQDVKVAGGDVLDVSGVTVAQGARLNALFRTAHGRVNVITFPAALDSIFMRPHLRTKTTLLKH